MSKIRNLFKKLSMKKKKSTDLDDIFIDDTEQYEEIDENTVVVDLDDEELKPHHTPREVIIPTKKELSYPTMKTPDAEDAPEGEDIPDFDLGNNKSEDPFSEIEDQIEDEYDSELKSADMTATSEINLHDSKITLKDKVEHLSVIIKDRFRSLNTKDLGVALKNKDKTKINIQNFKIEGLKDKASQINWNNLASDFFNKNKRSKYHQYFQISFLLITILIIASTINGLVSGKKDYNQVGKSEKIILNTDNVLTESQLAKIAEAKLFKTDDNEIDLPKKVVDAQKICKSATRKSRVNVKLINTIVLQDSVKSIASVQERSQRDLKEVREGETLLGEVKIDKIDRLKLIVKNLSTGECESIEGVGLKDIDTSRSSPISVLSPAKSKTFAENKKKINGIDNDGNNFKIDKKFLQEKLSNINDILTQARGIPMRNPDGSYAFKIVDIEPGGVFSYLGVQEGDIITEIGGEPIKDMNEVMNLFGKVTSLSNLNLTFKRGGEVVTQNYNIK